MRELPLPWPIRVCVQTARWDTTLRLESVGGRVHLRRTERRDLDVRRERLQVLRVWRAADIRVHSLGPPSRQYADGSVPERGAERLQGLAEPPEVVPQGLRDWLAATRELRRREMLRHTLSGRLRWLAARPVSRPLASAAARHF